MPPRRSQRNQANAPDPLPPPPPPLPSATPLPPPRSTISFLSLPPEIRNTIYVLLIPQNEPITPNVRVLFREARKRERTNEPFPSHENTLVFARTCKQIYDEMIPIYFGGNQFRFIDLYQMYQFLYMIGYERRRYLQSIEVLLVSPGHKNLGTSRRKVKSVRRLEEWAFDLLADSTMLKRLCLGLVYFVGLFITNNGIVSKSKLRDVVESLIASHEHLKVVVGLGGYYGYPYNKFWVNTGAILNQPFP